METKIRKNDIFILPIPSGEIVYGRVLVPEIKIPKAVLSGLSTVILYALTTPSAERDIILKKQMIYAIPFHLSLKPIFKMFGQFIIRKPPLIEEDYGEVYYAYFNKVYNESFDEVQAEQNSPILGNTITLFWGLVEESCKIAGVDKFSQDKYFDKLRKREIIRIEVVFSSKSFGDFIKTKFAKFSDFEDFSKNSIFNSEFEKFVGVFPNFDKEIMRFEFDATTKLNEKIIKIARFLRDVEVPNDGVIVCHEKKKRTFKLYSKTIDEL